MSTLSMMPAELEAMAIAELAALPPQQLLQIETHLADLSAWTKKIQSRLHAALDQRYGEPARVALLDSGRDFGTTHLQDGTLHVKFELPKKVTWDQKQLAAIAQRIVASGDRLEDYIDLKYTVSESRFTNWPEGLREQFASARTVAAGKPTFALTLVEGDGA
ncbi:MAG: hypothetical protein RLZZ09_172 [Pseudomonadota bacterium]|jgi:hypothetical protein